MQLLQPSPALYLGIVQVQVSHGLPKDIIDQLRMTSDMLPEVPGTRWQAWKLNTSFLRGAWERGGYRSTKRWMAYCRKL